MTLISFGGKKSNPKRLTTPTWVGEVSKELAQDTYLPIGMGRSYGDVGITSGSVAVNAAQLNRIKSFDSERGLLVCEPGVLLRDIQAIFVKLGWMLAVTPGTSFVTVGGAVANDVHGKEHHFSGTFGEHVVSLNLLRSSGESFRCSADENADFFQSTIGGLGLTGFITSVTLRLKKVAGPYINAETIAFGSVDEFFQISSETEKNSWQASVAWFDCSTKKAGRGIFTRGNSSEREYEPTSDDPNLDLSKQNLSFPIKPPFSLVNKLSLDAFNIGYFNLQKAKQGLSEVHYKSFYYPLDGVKNWNRIYGPKGFFQYQSVIPMAVASSATKEMLSVIRKSGQGSFLGVIKTFGDRKPAGLLSFARHGVTLALDFPNRGPETERLFQTLDKIVSESGGALNPSKDARMSREMFNAGYPEWDKFSKFRDTKFVSDFSRRLID